MMYTFIIGLLAVSVCVSAQSSCRPDPEVPNTSGIPTLYYKPFVPPQIAPTSTVWAHVVYETFFAVDCRYVTVTKVDDNLPQTGDYNAIVTSDTVTLTRIACIEETTIVTKRDADATSFENPDPQPTKAIEARNLQKKDTNQASVVSFAEKMADELPPDVQGLSLRAFQYIVQVNTALFALNLYNTGFDMTATCAVLQDPITAARLYPASIDPTQAANIICYAAVHGLYFNRSNAQLLSDLLGVIYSIEVKSGFTTNTTDICHSVELTSLNYLGIDENGIESYLCDTPLTTSPPTATGTNSTATSLVGTGETTHTLGTAGTGSPVTATSSPSAPYANSTVPTSDSDQTGLPLGSVPYTTLASTGIWATGTGDMGPASETFNITFPDATGGVNSSHYNGGHLPPSPPASYHYAVWTTSTTPAPRMPRY